MSVAALAPVLSWIYYATLKGSVMIVLVAIVYRLIGSRIDARWRHALWLLVLLRLALPAAPESDWSLFNLLPAAVARPEPPPHGVMAPAAASMPTTQMQMEKVTAPPFWLTAGRWLLLVWISGVVFLALRTAIASLRIRRAVGRALREHRGDPRVDALVDDLRARLGIRRRVAAVACDAVRTPALHGLLRPVLLLPPGMAETFSAAELRHVVLHELWHLRRFDVGVSWFLSAVQALHWFNPFVWFAASRIREERELACDELALSCLEEDERLGYGTTILKLLERFRASAPVPALVGIVNQKQKMKRRLMMIASFRNRTRVPILLAGALTLIAAVGLTDARGGERRILRKLDPASLGAMENLHGSISFELTSASLNDLLGAVASKSGVTITQSPEIATLPVQQARFTLRAENVPAHAVLMESLMPFGLMPKVDGNGVTIVKGECSITMHEGHHAEGGMHGNVEKRVVVVDADSAAVQKKIESAEQSRKEKRVEINEDGAAGIHEDRVIIRKGGPESCRLSADGTLHREMKLKMEVNGVQSEGKLTLDITAPPPAK